MRMVIKNYTRSLKDAFEKHGEKPNVDAGTISVSDIAGQIDAKIDLEEIIQSAKLSPNELIVVADLLSGDLPKSGKYRDYRTVKQFAIEKDISYKGFYALEKRAIHKIKKVVTQMS